MFENQDRSKEKDHYLGIGMAIGMAIFMPVGIVLMVAADNPAFIGVGAGMGLPIGLAIGQGLYRRDQQQKGQGVDDESD